MSMNIVFQKELWQVINIETAAHMVFQADFDVMTVDEYVWSETEFMDCYNNGYALWAYYRDNTILGFVAFRRDEETKTLRIIKLEVLQDDNKREYLRYIIRWLQDKAGEFAIVYLVQEDDYLKIHCFQGQFQAELRRNAFRKNNRDGILFTRKVA